MDSIDIINELDNTQFVNSKAINNPEDCIKHLGNTKTRYTVICQNICSFQKNFDSFIVFLSRLSFLPDVLIFTECRINEYSPVITLQNYTYYASTKFINQNDGIIVFVKSSLSVTIKEPDFDDANCVLIDIGNELSIVAIYRTPSIYNIGKFCNSLERTFQSIKTDSCIMVGDHNIDISIDTHDNRSMDYLDLTGHYGFIAGHQLPTRGPRCLDHVMVNTKKNTQILICNTDITDHRTVIVSTDKHDRSVNKPANRFYSKINLHSFLDDLENLNLNPLYLLEDVNVAVTEFTEIISNLVTKNTTLKHLKNREVIVKPWITPNLLKCIRKKDTLHLLTKKNPNDLKLKEKYKKYRNTCITLLHDLKRKYESKQLNDANGDSKQTWKCIKNICNINKAVNKNDELIKSTENPKDAVNKVNSYFSSVGKTLANNILSSLSTTEEQLVSLVKPPKSGTPTNSFFLTPTDPNEISKIISSLKTTSAPGWDNISNNILKHGKQHLSHIIAFITNLSFSSGIMPDSLKLANITPIHKAGNPQIPSNYRPISLLTSLSKIIEKVVNKRLLCYLEGQGILSDNQYGFRNNRSTNDAVSNLTDFVSKKLDSGKRCVGVFLDLAKAFDTVSRPILLRKMETYGIRGSPLEWFNSYLTGRKQRVRLDNCVSDLSEAEFGVPQGSVLGPSLFLLYINSLCMLNLERVQTFAFADDTAFVFYGDSWSDVALAAQSGLNLITNWLQENLLTLNTDKTKLIAFSISNRTSPKSDLIIKLHTNHSLSNTAPCTCSVVERVQHIKYLGVIIDENLSWKNQIAAMCCRLRKLLYLFKMLRSSADSQTIRLVYQALCQSVLTYCISAWGSACKTHLLRLERAQRAVLKVAHSKPFRYPTTLLHQDVRLLSVRQLFLLITTVNFHKNAPTNILETQTNRRLAWKIPKVRTSFGKRCHYYLGPYIYTKLNKKLNLVSLTRKKCRKTISDWLSSLNYHESELILTPSS